MENPTPGTGSSRAARFPVPGVLGGVAAGAGCGAEKPFGDAMLSDPIKRGFYLAIIAHCMECHARRHAKG
jgi:hypothetical protein